jgi:hypothetical protein
MQVEFQTGVISTAEEVARLKAAELEAEKRHEAAMHRGDFAAARIAADDWIEACDALTEYVAAHPDLYRDSG